jgi:sugar lactone lactonase YvrE
LILGSGQFGSVEGVAIDRESGILYAADSDNNKIWLADGDAQITEWLTYSDALGNDVPFEYPSGVAVDDNGDVYVLEDGNHIVKLTPQGELINEYSSNVYYSLSAIDVDANGTIYAVDNDQNVMLKWDDNGVTATTDGYGTKNLQFNSPSGIAVDDNGIVYVADTDNDRV